MDSLRGRTQIHNDLAASLGEAPVCLVQQSAGSNTNPQKYAAPIVSENASFAALAALEEIAEREISEAWTTYRGTFQDGIKFGQVNHKWWEEFKTKAGPNNKGKGIYLIWDKLNIPKSTAYRRMDDYLKAAGLSRPHNEKRVNRTEPPDDFEVLRAISKKMLHLGFDALKQTSVNPGHLAAAKTWALCCLEEKQHTPSLTANLERILS